MYHRQQVEAVQFSSYFFHPGYICLSFLYYFWYSAFLSTSSFQRFLPWENSFSLRYWGSGEFSNLLSSHPHAIPIHPNSHISGIIIWLWGYLLSNKSFSPLRLVSVSVCCMQSQGPTWYLCCFFFLSSHVSFLVNAWFPNASLTIYHHI